MPEALAHSGISRRWRAPALLTGITLVSGPAPVRSTVERFHDQVREVRRVRTRVAERQRPIDRQQRPVETVLVAKRTEEAYSLPTLWPVRGAVSSPFGWRRSPYGRRIEWHPGIDIFAAYGTPVRAAGDGEVVFAAGAGEYGALVVLDHGRATSRYAHLSAIWVRPGQRVLRGEPVGAVGETGRATAPHLHYEVRVGREPLDPECLLTKPETTTLAVGTRRSRACALTRARFGYPASPAARYTRGPGELTIATIARGPSSSRRE